MNEDKIKDLAALLVSVIVDFSHREDVTKGEVSAACGVALGTVMTEIAELFSKAELPGEPVPDEEEEAEEEGEEFRFLSTQERVFACHQLRGKYDDKDIRLILCGKQEIPQWLQKVIVERRG